MMKQRDWYKRSMTRLPKHLVSVSKAREMIGCTTMMLHRAVALGLLGTETVDGYKKDTIFIDITNLDHLLAMIKEDPDLLFCSRQSARSKATKDAKIDLNKQPCNRDTSIDIAAKLMRAGIPASARINIIGRQ